jgi:hypothetical protein
VSRLGRLPEEQCNKNTTRNECNSPHQNGGWVYTEQHPESGGEISVECAGAMGLYDLDLSPV